MSTPTHSSRGSSLKPGVLDPDELEIAPGTRNEGIQGWVPELASEEDLRVALEKAFDYRGDVTVTLKNGSKIEGYIFDRVTGPTIQASFVRVLPANSAPRLKIVDCVAEPCHRVRICATNRASIGKSGG